MIIPENYVLGKILLGWSSAFYRSWLRSARSLMTVRYGGVPPFRGEDRAARAGACIHGFRRGAPVPWDEETRAKLVRLRSPCSFCPDKSGRLTNNAAWLFANCRNCARACERKDLISRGTKYLGIYDRDMLYIHGDIQFATISRAVANLRARGDYPATYFALRPQEGVAKRDLKNSTLKRL